MKRRAEIAFSARQNAENEYLHYHNQKEY